MIFAQIWGAVNETWICQLKKITTATKSNETDFNEARLSFTSGSVCLDPSGQRRPIFSSFGNSKNKEESKVLTVMYSSAAWRLGPTDQRLSMDHYFSTRLVMHPINRSGHR